MEIQPFRQPGVGPLQQPREAGPIQPQAPVRPQQGIAQVFGVDQFELAAVHQQFPNLDVPHPGFDQRGNECGTTSLAMVLQYALGNNTVTANDIQRIDRAIRNWNIFTSPNDMIEYARARGVNAEGYNNGSLAEIKSFLDRGIPVVAMIDPDSPGNFNAHWVVIKGYSNVNPNTGEKGNFLIVNDPASPTGNTYVKEDDFLKQWKNVKMAGVETGYNNYFIAVAPRGTVLPPGRDDGIAAANALSQGVANVVNGLSDVTRGDIIGGIGRFAGGVIGTVGGAIGFGIGKAGDWVNGIGKKVSNWGDKQIAKGGFFRTIVGVGAKVVGGIA